MNNNTNRKSALLFKVKNTDYWCLRMECQNRCSNKMMKKIRKQDMCKFYTWPNSVDARGSRSLQNLHVICIKTIYIYIYRVSQEECAILRESVPYVKLYRYNPKHLYPKLNGYGDNGHRSLKL